MSSELMAWLGETTLATSAALVVVLLLRRPMRAAFGAGAAYALWALMPVALITVLLPAPVRSMALMPMAVRVGSVQSVAVAPADAAVPWMPVLLVLWLSGALAMAGLQLWQQRRFLRRLGRLRVHAHGVRVAAISAGLPAVTGVLRPRIVLPADFLHRYDADERALVVAHERQHIARGDLPCNALVALLRCVYWFNPLLHWAVACYRQDQELACDARVLRRHPRARRAYAQAMLKTQLDVFALPVGCHWHTHPIKERIAMLKRPSPRRWQTRLSAVLLLALFAGGGYVAWAQQSAAAPSAHAAAAAAAQYGANLQIEVDGERHALEMHSAAGVPFAFAIDTQAGHRWRGELSVEPDAPGQAKVHARLLRDGADMAGPVLLIARLGEAASLKLKTGPVQGAAHDVALSVRVRALDVPARRAAAATPVARKQVARAPEQAQAEETSSFDYSQHAPPRYPKEAANNGISGRVVMLVDVAADGSVQDVQVEESRPAGVFDAVSVEAVRKWKFKPVLEQGRPVAHRMRVPIDFDLDEPSAPSASHQGVASAPSSLREPAFGGGAVADIAAPSHLVASR
ncbi:TonB family protein [Pseudoxanthomonas winnipegensis]|uniref:TonB family protein n=1 Tax=Pseudoxanthomonas winnipegensis TaxID=2480810 RepID=UPI00102D852E|nr:TonB family protein [Pseudoxanthomonas winnipegensis]TAA41350.1 TonB family protein [Pseudoxanthomonas winnipegensis]